MSTAAYRPVFKASVLSFYVDSGTGDLWGRRDGMKSALQNALGSATGTIEAGLSKVVPADQMAYVYYLAPRGDTQDYDLFY